MPDYRIPNATNQPLPWAGDADGALWKPNDIQRAKKGEEWPPAWQAPPNYGDGYFARYTAYHAAPTWSSYITTPNVINYGGNFQSAGFTASAGYFNAIKYRCTSHDWSLQAIQHGAGYGGTSTLHYRIGVWEGDNVNILTGAGLMSDTGNQSVALAWNSQYPTNSIPAPGLYTGAGGVEGTAVLSQNTWYTIGIVYTSSMTAASSYGVNGAGQGYFHGGASFGSGSFKATNSGGTTSVYCTFEANPYSSWGQGNGWPTLVGNYSSGLHTGPMSAIKARVWQ